MIRKLSKDRQLANSAHFSHSASPLLSYPDIVFRIIITIAIAEFLIMWLLMLPVFAQVNAYFIPLIDSLLLALISSPVIYLWIIKPFVLAVKLRDQELQLERLNKSYFESIGAIEKLTSGLVHEIGNPVAAIEGLLFEISREKEQIPASVHQYMELLQDANNKLQLIIADLTKLAAPTSNTFELIDLNELVSQNINLLHYDERWYGVDIKVDLASNLQAVHGSPGQIKLLLSNLLSNALEAKSEQVLTITVTSMQLDCEVMLSIKDNGMGMDKDTLAQAFNAFYSQKDPAEHSGMGLYSSLAIIESHHGRVIVESLPHQGSEIKLYFPLETNGNQ
jgi:signal transduction histidine kinase